MSKKVSLVSKAAVLANRFILNHEGILFYANTFVTHAYHLGVNTSYKARKEELARAASVSIVTRQVMWLLSASSSK